MSGEVELIREYGHNEIERRFFKRRKIVGSCWQWLGCTDGGGYGMITLRKAKRVHRVSFVLYFGEIQNKMVIDHTCRNRSCFNPEHLREVSRVQNTLENSISIPAINKAKTHCRKGHELSADNIYTQPRKPRERYCRKCRAMRARKCQMN